jgi:hypothetical protein
MKKIDLGKIIEVKKLDPREVAEHLFPKHKHPKLALDRVLAGDGVLDADQISRFSLFSGIPIAELYIGSDWQSVTKGNEHVLTSGDYEARLSTEDWTTRLFHKGSLFHTFIIHRSSITLEEYIAKLNQEISNNK